MLTTAIALASCSALQPQTSDGTSLFDTVFEITASQAPPIRWSRPESGPDESRLSLPDPLIRALESRVSGTSEIRWTLEYLPGALPFGLGQQEGRIVEHLSTQTVGGSLLQRNYGDETGHHRQVMDALKKGLENPRARGQQLSRYAHLYTEPHETILFDDHVWHKKGPDIEATVSPPHIRGANAPIDLRACGILPMMGASRFNNELGIPHHVARRWRDPEMTTATTASGISLVSASSGIYMIEWELNEDNQPIRASLYADGKLEAESRAKLQKFGNRWFPVSTSFYCGGSSTPYQVISIAEATFDEPWHRQHPFVPEDIGIGFGHQLSVRGRLRLDDGIHYWDGIGLITTPEYYRLLWLYEFDLCDEARAFHEKFSRGAPDKPYIDSLNRTRNWVQHQYISKYGELPALRRTAADQVEDEWDQYVRAFVEKHKLVDTYADRAFVILKRAKELRDFHVEKAMGVSSKARKTGNDAKAAWAEAQAAEMKQRVFETYLVPGLRRLVPKSKHLQAR